MKYLGTKTNPLLFCKQIKKINNLITLAAIQEEGAIGIFSVAQR